MNRISWSNKARKQLLRLAKQDALKVYESVERLKHFPECQNIKKLSGHKHEYRLRIGRYRVLFDYDDGLQIIAVEEVKKRDERTY